MEATPQHVEIYETSTGKRPFEAWLRSLRDTRARQRIRTRIARVRLGNFGDSRTVGDGVVELRLDYGPGYRVYFGRDGDELVILLAGGDKSTQERDIEAARAYWADYKVRKKEEQDGTNS